GRNYLPKDLFNYFQQGPLVLLQVPLEKRVDNIFHEYVLSSQKKHRELYGESGLDLWHDGIEESLHRIKKRMDPVFFKETHRYLEQAYEDQKANGDLSLHKKWVELLLTQYYDPMYSYQIKRKKDRIVLTADQKEVETYLKAQKKKL
ncbi:MAG TPA: tRNA 2-selenouridine(34) synthase MnmH, partial [Eubacteriaceae bacterium]|nr:tRNA 2-selenouridine(34) synthase MnmH [Eubacteriaceae bacterium]